MGVIVEGTIKGKLPSEEVFAVHYPGYPSSMSRAIETLGGLDVIAKVHNSEANKLELSFRPGDPFSHPAFGHIRPCNSLLLKIYKRNVGDNQNDSCQSKNCDSTCNLVQSHSSVSVLSADIVARVQEAYHFNGMVDYQHVIPIHANAGLMSEMKGPADTENFGDVDDDCPMILVPPLFSPKDVPENIVRGRGIGFHDLILLNAANIASKCSRGNLSNIDNSVLNRCRTRCLKPCQKLNELLLPLSVSFTLLRSYYLPKCFPKRTATGGR